VTKSQVLLIGNESVGEEGRIGGAMGEDVLYTGHSDQEYQEELGSCASSSGGLPATGVQAQTRRGLDECESEPKNYYPIHPSPISEVSRMSSQLSRSQRPARVHACPRLKIGRAAAC
jgi:hypothetical protein